MKIVRLERAHISYFVPANFLERVHNELRLHLGPEDDATELLSFIRYAYFLTPSRSRSRESTQGHWPPKSVCEPSAARGCR